MKKSVHILISLCLFVFFGLMVCGCDGSLLIDIPKVTRYGNIIFWDEIDGSDSYVVTINEEQKEVFTNYYVFDNLSESKQVFVRAKVGEKVSRKSDTVTVIKTSNFTQNETYEIALTSQKTYDILPTYNYVKISGSASDSQINIQNRSKDLVIELNDVTLTASQGNNCITTSDGKYDIASSNFTAVFIINGNNTINGSNYTTTPKKQAENSGKYGTKGGDGGNGIVLPNIVINGQGALSVSGGNGGNGGDGADSSGVSTSSNGSGGNGGNGGSGILCNTLVIAMGADGVVKPYGGVGGKGGKVGINGSIMSGPWVSIAQSRKDGVAGSSGSGYDGNLVRLSGTFD